MKLFFTVLAVAASSVVSSHLRTSPLPQNSENLNQDRDMPTTEDAEYNLSSSADGAQNWNRDYRLQTNEDAEKKLSLFSDDVESMNQERNLQRYRDAGYNNDGIGNGNYQRKEGYCRTDRGERGTDGNPRDTDYTFYKGKSYSWCRTRCTEVKSCTGYETYSYNSASHCEIWWATSRLKNSAYSPESRRYSGTCYWKMTQSGGPQRPEGPLNRPWT